MNLWKNPGYMGWSRPIESDRVLYSLSGPHGTDEALWASDIVEAITTIEQMHPSAQVIVLQPVVGGPNHMNCQFGGMKQPTPHHGRRRPGPDRNAPPKLSPDQSLGVWRAHGNAIDVLNSEL